MPLSFPLNPVVNQIYSYNNASWRWDGERWRPFLFGGATGIQGATGATGPVGPVLEAIGTGNTIQRPIGPVEGYVRFNTDLESTEVFYANNWFTSTISTKSIDELADVDTTANVPADGQALIWSSNISKWVPGNVALGAGGGGVFSLTGNMDFGTFVTPSTTTIDAGTF